MYSWYLVQPPSDASISSVSSESFTMTWRFQSTRISSFQVYDSFVWKQLRHLLI